MADDNDLQRLREGELDLTGCDFRNADLSNMDLRKRDFSHAHLEFANCTGADFRDAALKGASLVGMKANGANFAGAQLSRIAIVGVDFSGANLYGADFSSSHIQKSNFGKADLRSADFSRANLNENVSFDSAVVDEKTNFDLARGPRSLSRDPILHNYTYDRGVFRRRSDKVPPPPTSNRVGADLAKATQSTSADLSKVRQRLSDYPAEARTMANSLVIAIREHIVLAEASIPNEPTALTEHQKRIAFLSDIANGLSKIVDSIPEQSKSTPNDSADLTGAAHIVADLSDKLTSWWAENGETAIKGTMAVGLIGVCSAFLSWCGAPQAMAFPVAVAAVGGRHLTGQIKKAVKAIKG